jgi:type II secretion system protein J
MNRRGFTLLEILLAIVLASLLLSSIYGVFTATSTAKERVDSQSAGLHLARVLTNRINREVLGLALTVGEGKAFLLGGLNSRGESYLKMLTSSGGVLQPGMSWVNYRLGDDQDGQTVLWRSEWSEAARSEGSEERLVQGIDQVVFRFFDGQEWREQWNSLEDGRPVLIQMEMTLGDLADRPPLQSVFQLSQMVLE